MPTPVQVFAEIATRYGGVDGRDAEAVRRWFTETLPTLEPERIADVLGELIDREGEPCDADFPRAYPTDVDLPALQDSLPAPTPRLALGWVIFLRRMIYRMTARSR